MKIVFLLLLVDRLFNALFLPVVTRYITSQADEVGRLVQTTMKVLSALIIPLAIAGTILGGDVIAIAFGERYEGAVPLLDILIGYFALTVLNSVFVCVLIGSGREKEYTRMVSWGSVVLCIAVVAGTALFGVHGAAYAVVLGELVTVTLMMRETRKAIAVSLTTILVRPLVAGACMIGTAFFFREMNPLLLTAISFLVFAFVIVLLKGFSARELRFLREKFV
jgi:O-antigen/teichoic acid export membrane protein